MAGAACLAISACSSAPLSPWTTKTPPLALVPAQEAGVQDKRARFREILCSVLEAHGHELPDYRPCEEALTRVGDEPAPTGKPVDLGSSRKHFLVALVPGVGWECFGTWLKTTGSIAVHLQQFGYEARLIEVGGLMGSEANAIQIREAILALQLPAGERRLILVGYSKGAPDILEAIVRYPEIRQYVAAVVSAAGTVGGSPLANPATESQLDLVRHWPGSKCQKGDGHAIESLRPDVRRTFLARNPLPTDFPYYSLVTYPEPARISSVLKSSYKKLAKVDARNDSQMIFYDEVIPGSSLVGYVNADHWALAVPINRTHTTIAALFATQNAFPREALLEALLRFVEEDLETRPLSGPNPAQK
jgi:hypothetical protein